LNVGLPQTDGMTDGMTDIQTPEFVITLKYFLYVKKTLNGHILWK